MKKFMYLLLILCLTLSVSGCGGSDVAVSSPSSEPSRDVPAVSDFVPSSTERVEPSEDVKTPEEELAEFLDSYEGRHYKPLYDAYGIRGWDERYDRTPHGLEQVPAGNFVLVQMGPMSYGEGVGVPLPDVGMIEECVANGWKMALDDDGLYVLVTDAYKAGHKVAEHIGSREGERIANYMFTSELEGPSGVKLALETTVTITVDDTMHHDYYCERLAESFAANEKDAGRGMAEDRTARMWFDGYAGGMTVFHGGSVLYDRDLYLRYSTDVSQFLDELDDTSCGYSIDVRVVTDVTSYYSISDSDLQACKDIAEPAVREIESFVFTMFGMQDGLRNVYDGAIFE